MVRKSVKAFSQALANPASQTNNIYNIVVRYHDVDSVVQINKNITCDQCLFTCSSKAALQLHKTNTHGLYSQIRLRMASAACKCCTVEFHGRTRLFRHINYRSDRCKSFYLLYVQPMPESDAKKLDKQACAEVKKQSGQALPKPAVHVPSEHGDVDFAVESPVSVMVS